MLRLGRYAVATLFVAGSLAACDKFSTQPGPTVVNTPPAIGATVASQTIEGTIEGSPGEDLISVSGKQIKLDPNAAIRSGTLAVTFADLRAGMKVKVVAEPTVAGAMMKGTLVDVIDSVGLPHQKAGTIAGFADKGSFYEFTLADKLFRGDAATQIVEGTTPMTAVALQDAVAIDVTGLQRADYVYATRIEVKKGAPKEAVPGRRNQ